MTTPQRPFLPLQPCFLACLFLPLLFTMAGCGPAEEVTIMNPELEARPLSPESPVEASLSEGEVHRYAVTVPAKQAARLWVEQMQQDVWLEVGDREHRLLLSVDSPTGDTGTESVLLLAQDGETRFLVDIRAFEGGASPEGGYRIELEPFRPATDSLRALGAAEWDRSRGHAFEMLGHGDLASARRHFRQAAEGFRRLRGESFAQEPVAWVDLLLADSLSRLGRLLSQTDAETTGEPQAALAALDEAATLEQRLGRQNKRVENVLEAVRIRLTHYLEEGTRELARDSVETARSLNDPALLGWALNVYGDALAWQGDDGEALDAWEEALALYRGLPDRRKQLIATHLRLGHHFLTRQAPDQAGHHLHQARELTTAAGAQPPFELRLLLTDLATLQARRQELRNAPTGDFLEQAEADLGQLLEEAGDPRSEARIATQLGTVRLQAGRPAEAEESFQRAVDIYRQIDGAEHDRAVALHQLARARFQDGRIEEALELHRQAADGLDANERQARASIRYGEARALFHLGRFEEARQVLQSVVEDAELLRGDSTGVSLRQAYLASRRHYWELYVATLVKLHGRDPSDELATAALEMATQAQARALLDLVMESAAEVRREAAPSTLRRRSQLHNQLDRARQALLEVETQRSDARDKKQTMRRLEEQLHSLLAELDRVEREISSQARHTVLQAQPMSVEEIRRQLLDADTTLLIYFVGEEVGAAWLLTRDRLTMKELPGRPELETTVRQFTEHLPHRSPESTALQKLSGRHLSEQLLKPFATQLTSERLLVVADGALHGVPFAALPLPEGSRGAIKWNDREPLLVEHFEVSRIPAPAVLATLRRREAERTANPGLRPDGGPLLAVVANPDFGSTRGATPGATRTWRSIRDLEPLPFTAQEAAELVDLVDNPDRTLQALGTEANRQLFESGRLTPYPIVHIATHAYVDTEHPELSTLVLSDRDAEGRPRPALLQMYELYELELPAELVVLSACRTARGEPVRGEGMVGITRGFLYAGATRVLHSLWDVDDEATRELMVAFYRPLLRGAPPAAALRWAQRQLRDSERWSAPYYWAGFVLTGDWRPLPAVQSGDGDDARRDEDIGQTYTGSGDPPPPPKEDDDLPPPVQRPPSAQEQPEAVDVSGGDG